MKLNFRKIVSALASTAMLGSTVAIAAAANFPAPFVQNGVADVAIVYGSNLDLGAVTDISTALSASLSSSGGAVAGSTPSGDYIKLAKPSDKLNMNNTVSGVFGSTIDADELDNLLADGVYTNDENTEYKYQQKLTLGTGLQVNYFADSDYKNKAPTVGINLSSSHVVMNYTITFTDLPESDVSSGDLVDFETTNLNILGKDYFVLDAKNNSNVKLTLLDSADTAILSEGETSSMSIGSKIYEVGIEFISSSEVKLKVNNEITTSLAEGGTFKLSDGSYVGIKDILAQDYAGGIKKVEFSIGSGKLDITSGSTVKLNDKSVSGLISYISRATSTSNKERLNSITIEWKTDNDAFITADSSLTMPGFGSIELSANEFNPMNKDLEELKVQNSGSDTIEVTANIKDGKVTVPILFANSSGEFTHLGDASDKQLLTSFGVSSLLYNRTSHDFLVASWNNTRDAESYVLRFEQFRDQDGVNYTTPEKLTSNGWSNACGEKSDSGGSTPTCDIGSLSLTLNSINGKDSTGGRYVNFSGNAGSSFYRLYTQGGLEVNLPVNIATDVQGAGVSADGAINLSNWSTFNPGHTGDTFWLFVTEEDKDGTLGLGPQINISIDDQSDGDLEVPSVSSPRVEQHKELGNDNNLIGRVRSDLATEFWRLGDSASQRYAVVNYPGAESYLEAFVAGTTSTGSIGGELGNVNVMAKDLATSGMSGKNLIVVGGSCVNTAAKSLLGESAGCGASWDVATGAGPGEWIIQTFANPWGPNKIATLVAGWETEDTQSATTHLTTQTVDTSVGQKIPGSTTIVATPTLAA